MKKKIKITLILLLIIIGSSYGQQDFRSGFIITFANDTIQGQVDYRSNTKNYESCIFKDEQGETEYYPNQIIGFGYSNDKFFSSQILEDSFVEVLVSGDISLYKSKEMYHVKKDTSVFDLQSIIKKVEVDGKIGFQDKSKWRGILIYLTGDCLKNGASSIASMKLDERSLSKLIVKYNKCKGTDFKEFKVDKPWTKFQYGVSVGVSRSELKSDYGPGISYLKYSYKSVDPSVGVLVEMLLPRVSEKISFQGELHFLKSSYSSLVEIEGRGISILYNTYIDLTSLSIPLSIKYYIPANKYSVYLQGGLSYDFFLRSKTRLTREVVRRDRVDTYPETTAFEVDRGQFGYWGGVGLLKSYRKFKASLAVRYFRVFSLSDTRDIRISSNRISLNLIVIKK